MIKITLERMFDKFQQFDPSFNILTTLTIKDHLEYENHVNAPMMVKIIEIHLDLENKKINLIIPFKCLNIYCRVVHYSFVLFLFFKFFLILLLFLISFSLFIF